MALAGWNENQKLKLTIDNSKVDEDLTDFPVNITLSSSTGQTGFDATRIFDALTTSGTDSYTKLLLHMDGDQSDSGHKYNTEGTPQLYPPTTISGLDTLGYMYFDGVTEYLFSPASNDWNFDGDFTIDFWLRNNLGSNKTLIKSVSNENWNLASTGDWILVLGGGSRLTFYVKGVGNAGAIGTVLPTSPWHHVAVVRSGSSTKLYLNGTIDGNTLNSSATFGNTQLLKIAGPIQTNLTTGSLNGYMTEIRISKGIARWTSNFTPPTEIYEPNSYTKLLLHFDGDQSASAHGPLTFSDDTDCRTSPAKFSGCYRFEGGVTDYLSIPDSDDWYFGSSDFTIDFWIRSDGVFGDNGIFGTSEGGAGNKKMSCYLDSLLAGNLTIHKNGPGGNFNVNWAWNPSDNTWYHVAIVRNGTSWYLFVDGVQTGGTQTQAASFENVSSDFRIGTDGEGWKYFKGMIDEFRVSKGIARWIYNFTPAEGPYGCSWGNRRKIAITDSDDHKLSVEIDIWDMEEEEANLWVRVPTIVSGTNTQLYLYYDHTQDEQDTRPISETNDTFTAISGSMPDISKWQAYDNNDVEIADNKLRFYIGGFVNAIFRLTGNFDVQIDFDNLVCPNVDYNGAGVVVFIDAANQGYIRAGYVAAQNGVNFHGNSNVAGMWGAGGHVARANNYGKLRIIRSGASIETKYQDGGGGWVTLFNQAWANGIVKIQFTSSGNSTFNYDNFTVNSADYISGYVDDTGGIAAQSVWDEYFSGVWHMSQDPSGGVNSIKDSTVMVNDGTPAGAMVPGDWVDGKIGKAINFDGLDDYINCGSSAYLEPGLQEFTAECLIKATNTTVKSAVLGKQNQGGNLEGWIFRISQSGNDKKLHVILRTDATEYIACRGNTQLQNDTDYNVTFTYDASMTASGVSMFVNDNEETILIEEDTLASPVWNIIDMHIASGGHVGVDPFGGIMEEVRISNVDRSPAWVKATYYSNWNDLITFSEEFFITFVFSNPTPIDLFTVYGITQQLYLTTTVTGIYPSYVYDATFYNADDDSIINSTVSGVQSGQPAGVIMPTTSGTNYQWYVTATSSGFEDTSSTYIFTNKFLCAGQVHVNNLPASGIPVRLYLRDTGEYIGGTTSAGISGTYEIETNYNEYHYIVGLYNLYGTNALIYDYLKPE